MDSNSSLFLLDFLHEPFSDVIWRRGSVNELEVKMLEPLVDELFAVVGGLVKADNKSDAELLENRDVIVGSEGTISISDVQGSRERDELSGDDPVKISIFNALEMLIFLDIEFGVVVPSKFDRVLHSLKRV